MTPKTERFELRLNEEILNRIDEWRSVQKNLPSRAEAVRRLVEIGLGRDEKVSIKLSDGEKLISMMLRDLFKHHKVNGDINPDFVEDVIVGGHYWALPLKMSGIFHDYEDKHEDLQFVRNVLEMWSFIERAYAKLSSKEKVRVGKEAELFGTDLKFKGFDGNNEAELIDIARFLVERMERFEDFQGRSLNSHMPTKTAYQRMLKVFQPMLNNLFGSELNSSQLIDVLNAMKHPE